MERKQLGEVLRGADKYAAAWNRMNDHQKVICYLFSTGRTAAQVSHELLAPIDNAVNSIAQKLSIYSLEAEIGPYAVYAEPEIKAVLVVPPPTPELDAKIESLNDEERGLINVLVRGGTMRNLTEAMGGGKPGAKAAWTVLKSAREKLGLSTLTQMVEAVRNMQPAVGIDAESGGAG